MPKEHDRFNATSTDIESSGWMASLLADEDMFDRRMMWRLGTWAGCAVGLLTVAVLAAQSSTVLRRERTAYAEMSRQAQQIQLTARESQDEARRLAAAIDTLNGDRDRLYSRVTVLEQGLDSVTGSINKQAAGGPPSAASPAPSPPMVGPAIAVAPMPESEKKIDIKSDRKTDQKADLKSDPKTDAVAVPLTPSPDKRASPKPMADAPAESKPVTKPDADEKKDAPTVTSAIEATTASQPVQRTDFGVDIGTANSVEGLRAVWRGALATQAAVLGGLQPIIVIKERTDGFGLQLRLVAGPIPNAAEAAKVCARLIASKRGCETSVYDGQRLAMNDTDERTPAVSTPKHARRVRTKPEVPPPAQPGFTSIFGTR